jgi:DNA mismatch endonuclease (patch repair protein)
MDRISKSLRSDVMRRVKSKGSRLERLLQISLWHRGIRYRKNVATLYGKPDIAMLGKGIVIFVDACFWHRCPEHCRKPHNNQDYWHEKIEKNKARDLNVTEYYIQKGWTILRFWEHDIKIS